MVAKKFSIESDHYRQDALAPALDRLGDSIVILDQSWAYVYINDTGLGRLNKQKEELIGHNLWELFPYLIGTPFEIAAKKSMADHKQREIEDYYESSGTWYRSKIIPFEGGILMHIIDVSELKKVTDMNDRLLSSLEQALDSGSDRNNYRRYSI